MRGAGNNAAQIFLIVCAVVFIALVGWWGVFGIGLYIGMIALADWLTNR